MKVYKKNPSWMTGVMATILLCSLLFSCNNDDFLKNSTDGKAYDNICFGISSDNGAETKGGYADEKDGYTANRFVLRSEDSADTLCVRAIVSDGICTSGFEGKQVITRGTPVGGTNFYDKFHVQAYWKKGGNPVGQFYIDEVATNSGNNIWNTATSYYWPGAQHAFQFYAWAPTDVSFDSTPSTPEANKELKYTVPTDVTKQKDVVVATTAEIGGDNNQTVPLTFKHICTAVRFAVGSQMQAGSIKSVALKGIKNQGTYNIERSTWALDNATTDFTQVLNKATIGTETAGTEITTPEGTFMMLPQTLGTSGKLEVVFYDKVSGKNRILSASLSNQEWPMGKTVTYKLSITPEYELKFVSEPTAQDAHYIIYPITIRANQLGSKGWKLASNDTKNVTFVENFANEDIKRLIDNGYWLKDYCGKSEITSTSNGDIKIYVFIKENVTDADRDIILTLTPVDYPNATPEIFSVKQYCPAWNNGIGVERKQETDYPWGFNWDSSMKITYSMPKGFWMGIWHALFTIFGDTKYVTQEGLAWAGTWKVTVDFSKVPKLTTATSTTDGLTNTWEIYTFEGISDAESIMNQLESWGGVPDKTLPTNPTEFAAAACAKKNPFGVKIKSDQGQNLYIPTLEQKDMVWYLPAQEEAPNMKDDLFNLSDNYWTSTAITDPGTTSYKYTAGGMVSPEDRNSVIHVRAVRKK